MTGFFFVSPASDLSDNVEREPIRSSLRRNISHKLLFAAGSRHFCVACMLSSTNGRYALAPINNDNNVQIPGLLYRYCRPNARCSRTNSPDVRTTGPDPPGKIRRKPAALLGSGPQSAAVHQECNFGREDRHTGYASPSLADSVLGHDRMLCR